MSYLKAAEYQDGHPGYSDPLDEQNFIVNTVNEIEHSKFWASTAIVITYDDSDGWYDHQKSPIVNGSHDATLDSTGKPIDTRSARRSRSSSGRATTAAASARGCR